MTIKTDSYESLRKTLRRIIGSSVDQIESSLPQWVVEVDPDLPDFSAKIHEQPVGRVQLSTTAHAYFRDEQALRVLVGTIKVEF